MAIKIPLDMIEVASPCSASWDAMHGDDRTRFCEQCTQYVYNLTALTQADAEALIMEHEGKLCVRYYRRIDGTIMTNDCPVGWRGVRRRLAIGASVLAAAIFAILGFLTHGAFAEDGPNRGARFRNPIEVIHDLFFPRAVAGGICPPPAPAPQVPPPDPKQ